MHRHHQCSVKSAHTPLWHCKSETPPLPQPCRNCNGYLSRLGHCSPVQTGGAGVCVNANTRRLHSDALSYSCTASSLMWHAATPWAPFLVSLTTSRQRIYTIKQRGTHASSLVTETKCPHRGKQLHRDLSTVAATATPASECTGNVSSGCSPANRPFLCFSVAKMALGYHVISACCTTPPFALSTAQCATDADMYAHSSDALWPHTDPPTLVRQYSCSHLPLAATCQMHSKALQLSTWKSRCACQPVVLDTHEYIDAPLLVSVHWQLTLTFQQVPS